MTKATISPKGQVAIPKGIRERLRLHTGAQVLIEVRGDSLVLTRLSPPPRDWRGMRGMFRGGAGLLQDLAGGHAAEAARDDARFH